MNQTSRIPTELCALTDSLASSIRWRMRDYEAILRIELEILAEPDGATSPARRRDHGTASRTNTKRLRPQGRSRNVALTAKGVDARLGPATLKWLGERGGLRYDVLRVDFLGRCVDRRRARILGYRGNIGQHRLDPVRSWPGPGARLLHTRSRIAYLTSRRCEPGKTCCSSACAAGEGRDHASCSCAAHAPRQ